MIDHFSLGKLRLYSSTVLDVIEEYGNEYEFINVTDRVFRVNYKDIGLSFLCGDYVYNDSVSLHEYYVLEIEISKPSKLMTRGNIGLYSSCLFDVIDAYGYPQSASHSKTDKVTQNYPGLSFVFNRQYFNVPWETDDSLHEPIDMIVVTAELNFCLDGFYQSIKMDRWLKFCSYARASEWGMLADGSLVFPRMHVFRYVVEGNAESYAALQRPGYWYERSRIFCVDIQDYDCYDDAPIFSYKTVFLSTLPEIAEHQDLALDPEYPSDKSIKIFRENYLDYEKKRLEDIKRRVLEKDFYELLN